MSPAKKGVRRSAKKSAAKKRASKQPTTKKSATKKPARKQPKTPVESDAAPASSQAADARAAIAQQDAARLAAKAQRRGRARQRQAHVAERMGTTNYAELTRAMLAAMARERQNAEAASSRTTRTRSGAASVLRLANDDPNRWVPLGPSVVRRGQADGRPRVTGRVRDLAVDSTGRRAYAASGKAGVWYTEDAGSSWRPVGGYVTSPGRIGGASTDLSCGCLLVHFGDSAATDYVMVGTGETPRTDVTSVDGQTHLDFSGRGVLAGRGPVGIAGSASPFEGETGIGTFENFSILRLAGDPERFAAADFGAAGDRVVAASEDGLFLGTRTSVGGNLDWVWTRVASIDAARTWSIPQPGGNPPEVHVLPLTDVQWIPLPGTGNSRILVAIARLGVAWCDSLAPGAAWTFVRQINCLTDGIRISGAHKLSSMVDGKMYVLHGRQRTANLNDSHDDAFLVRIPDVARPAAAGGPGIAQRVRGVPDGLWGAQRHWNQAVFAERVAGVDRVWVGGSGVTPYPGADFSAALYCFDVAETGTNAPRLVPAVGVSRTAAPPAGEGANTGGLVGNGVHADVHAISVTTLADGSRHVWVGCDGGIYVSERGGRVNTFQSRATGLAIIEAGFVAVHPTSSHFCALGAQDNGTQVRSGDTVWEMVQLGDGGGVMFHPTASQYVVAQFIQGSWFSSPAAGFVGPIDRAVGGRYNDTDRESTDSMFYSGCDAIANPAGGGRIAVGTNRVWISDDLGTAPRCTWKVIRYDTAQPRAASDARPGGADSLPRRGVPDPALGPVAQIRWAAANRLYVVYQQGIVRHDETTPGTWTTTLVLGPAPASGPDPSTMRITDLAPIPGGTDFYFTTLGDNAVLPAVPMDTCWLFRGGTFTPTNLRRQLDTPASGGSPLVLGPNDPAHAVCLDPDDDAVVFVGTLGGIWRGERAADGTHSWATLMNGLPITCVSDLRVWRERGPNPVQLKLLRAATQSRGVWEVNLAASEPRRTYLRVHARDDRRRLPTPMEDPRLAPPGVAVPFASPDIVVRPRPRPASAAAVPFPLRPNAELGPANSGSYHLWTFQTAFRWLFPAIRADGLWSDQLADLIRLHRTSTPGLGTGDRITKATWDAVVGGTRLDAARAVTAAATDAWAVYETPWQLAGAAPIVPTEVDVLELVLPLKVTNGVWGVYSEPCTVDVLLHHRDTRAINDAYTALFWKAAPTEAALLAEPAAPFATLDGWNGTATVPTPTGWNRVTVSGSAVHRLPVALDAFMPRAISIDVDLTDPAPSDFVLFVAVCGGGPEAPPAASGASATVVDLVRAWPRAAMRLVQRLGARPV